jgi:hypothetical protein
MGHTVGGSRFPVVPGARRGTLFPGRRSIGHINRTKERTMGKGLLLWLIGVPIPIILLLWFLFG